MIQVQEMLRLMERTDERGRPQPFTVLVCTCDEQRGTGGKLLELQNVVLSRLATENSPTAATPHVRRRKAPEAPKQRDTQTRVLFNPITGDKITAHIRLIIRFNTQIVID
jgi:hypothetical protein